MSNDIQPDFESGYKKQFGYDLLTTKDQLRMKADLQILHDQLCVVDSNLIAAALAYIQILEDEIDDLCK